MPEVLAPWPKLIEMIGISTKLRSLHRSAGPEINLIGEFAELVKLCTKEPPGVQDDEVLAKLVVEAAPGSVSFRL